MDVSIVVLTWEDFERTRACVLSLPPEAEIVVVDNGSSATIGDALRELCHERGTKYIQAGSNLGYAKGMNLGVRNSTRSRVILSNNDVIVRDGAVKGLLAQLDDPDVGAAFPGVVTPDGLMQTEGGRFLTIPVGIAHATGLSLLMPSLRIVASPEMADWLTGPFVALRRETLTKIGGVDESSFFYSEDMRLCWAVRQLGMRLAYVPDAVVVHEADGTTKQRWAVEEISRRRTREFIRASREIGGWRGRLACAAYVYGVLLRFTIGRGSVRRAIARGAIEGMRAR